MPFLESGLFSELLIGQNFIRKKKQLFPQFPAVWSRGMRPVLVITVQDLRPDCSFTRGDEDRHTVLHEDEKQGQGCARL